MSGTKQTEFTLSGQSTDWTNPDAARIYIERIMEPVFKKVRNTVNQLARDVVSMTSSGLVAAKHGLVVVDAASGPVTVTIPHPTDSFHPIIVVKVDATANVVTVQAFGGELISGASTDTLTTQWQCERYEADATAYYKLTGSSTVAPDITIGPFILATDQTDYSPAGWSSARYVLLSPSAQSVAINSFDGSASVKRKTIINVATGDFDLRLSRNSFVTAVAANRLQYRKANLVGLIAGDSVDIWKDETSGYWRVI